MRTKGKDDERQHDKHWATHGEVHSSRLLCNKSRFQSGLACRVQVPSALTRIIMVANAMEWKS